MVAKATFGPGILLLLCVAAPPAALPATPDHALPHRHHHHRHRPAAARPVAATAPEAPASGPASATDALPTTALPAGALDDLRMQVAENVTLLDQVATDLRGRFAQAQSDTARILVRQDAQAREANVLARRLDGIDQRLDAGTHDHQLDTAALQKRLAGHDMRLDVQDRQLTDLAAVRSGPPILAMAAAVLAMLLAAAAVWLGFRQRAAAVTAAETQTERLFLTYRFEFDMLAQLARDLEARLRGEQMEAQVHLHDETAARG